MKEQPLRNNIHYWLGQMSMADEMIRELRKRRGAHARARLREAEKARREVVAHVERLARRLS